MTRDFSGLKTSSGWKSARDHHEKELSLLLASNFSPTQLFCCRMIKARSQHALRGAVDYL